MNRFICGEGTSITWNESIKDLWGLINMNKTEYLIGLIKRDVELININKEDIEAMRLKLLVELKDAEEKCEMYEEMYEADNELVMSAFLEYERIRSPITRLEAESRAYKLCLIDHYEELLREKKEFDENISKSLAKAKHNVTKLDEVVEMIKGVFI